MKRNFLEKNGDRTNLKAQWNKTGRDHAEAVNEMIKFGDRNGWENWKGKDPEDISAIMSIGF
jgi:hypothetical protein